MPLRRLYAGTSHPVAYSNATLAAGMVALMAINTGVSVRASERASERTSRQVVAQAEREREQTEAAKAEADRKLAVAKAEAEEKIRRSACTTARSMAQVYDNPEVTEVGRDARKAWEDLSKLFRCDGK